MSEIYKENIKSLRAELTHLKSTDEDTYGAYRDYCRIHNYHFTRQILKLMREDLYKQGYWIELNRPSQETRPPATMPNVQMPMHNIPQGFNLPRSMPNLSQGFNVPRPEPLIPTNFNFNREVPSNQLNLKKRLDNLK